MTNAYSLFDKTNKNDIYK